MEREGGCLCGAVRYRISAAPRQVLHCHCSICRRASGAPVVTWLTLPAAGFACIQGAPRRYVSSPKASRQFCADCGTQLTFEFNETRGVEIDVTLASLDDPGAFAADQHVWFADRLRCLSVDPHLPVRAPPAQ
jgi:hypothetical protein